VGKVNPQFAADAGQMVGGENCGIIATIPNSE